MPTEEVRPDEVKPEGKVSDAETTVVEDSLGMGLGNFLTPPSPAKPDGEEEKTASEEDAKGEEEGTEEAAKEEDKSGDKKPDEKSESAPEGDKKKEESTPSPDDKNADKKEAKKEDKPKAEDKPKKEDPNVKRLRDTQNWATDLNKQVQEQNRQMAIMQKKIDGTYDEERDDPKQTVEQIETAAEVKGRTRASKDFAISQFGEEQVTEDLQKFHDIFGQDRHVQASIMETDQPAIEAIKMVKRHAFFEEYGYEPEDIIEKIRVKVRAEEGKKIREEESAKLANRIKGKNSEATGLAGLTSKGGTTSGTEKAKGPVPLKSMFDN
jgi:hypothetical protein